MAKTTSRPRFTRKNVAEYAPSFVAGFLGGAIALLVVQGASLTFDYGASSILHWSGTWFLGLPLSAICLCVLKALADSSVENSEAGNNAKDVDAKSPGVKITDETLKTIVDVWKQVVDVQMHFNEMVMRIRNLGLTLVLAAVGAAAVAMREQSDSLGAGGELGTYLLMGGLAGWLAFYTLDRWYYHRLLVGAVLDGIEIEEAVAQKAPYIKLGRTITKHSRVRLSSGEDIIKARHKLDLFYLGIALLLALFLRFTAQRPPRAVHEPLPAANAVSIADSRGGSATGRLRAKLSGSYARKQRSRRNGVPSWDPNPDAIHDTKIGVLVSY